MSGTGMMLARLFVNECAVRVAWQQVSNQKQTEEVKQTAQVHAHDQSAISNSLIVSVRSFGFTFFLCCLAKRTFVLSKAVQVYWIMS